MLGVFFHPSGTQLVECSVKKQALAVSRLQTVKPGLDYLLNGDIAALTGLLREIRSLLKHKDDDVCCVLPDACISVDCGEREFVAAADWDIVTQNWAGQLLQIDRNDYYIETPTVLTKKNRVVITAAAIEKKLVDGLLRAGDAAGLQIMRVETAGFSLRTLLDQWDREQCIMEVWADETAITSYSPIRGLFKISLPDAGLDSILDAADREEALRKGIVMHDFTAYYTHGLANNTIPIYILSPKQAEINRILQKTEFASRLLAAKLPAEKVKSAKYSEGELLEYAAAIGSLLAAVGGKPRTAGTDEEADAIEVRGLNFIPAKIRKETYQQRRKRQAGKLLQTAVAGLVAVLALEGGAWLLVRQALPREVPAALEGEFRQAQAGTAIISRWRALVATAKAEDQQAVATLETLLSAKPPELGLIRLELLDTQGRREANIALEGQAADAEKFSQFVSSLNSRPEAGITASINKIGSANEGEQKTALIRGSSKKR